MLLSKLARIRGLARVAAGQLRVLSAPPPQHQQPRWTSTAPPPKSSRLQTGGLFAAGVGLGLAWAHWGDDVLLPKVEAATPVPDDDTPSRRKANNFIADVVKSCKHGVVYIEILDGRYNRYSKIFSQRARDYNILFTGWFQMDLGLSCPKMDL